MTTAADIAAGVAAGILVAKRGGTGISCEDDGARVACRVLGEPSVVEQAVSLAVTFGIAVAVVVAGAYAFHLLVVYRSKFDD